MTIFDPPLLYKDTFRIPSTRLRGHDYAEAGMYSVTICTKGKVRWFGEVRDDVMVLSEAGKIVEECWKEIPQHYAHVRIDEFVVMPNHIHGILYMGEPSSVETPYHGVLSTNPTETPHCGVSTEIASETGSHL